MRLGCDQLEEGERSEREKGVFHLGLLKLMLSRYFLKECDVSPC